MTTESLQVVDGRPGLRSLVDRAVGLDASASARFRQLDEQSVDVFITTPFQVVASRRITGRASRDGAVVAATDLLDALHADSETIGPARDPNWPGALPPASGFAIVDTLPVQVVRELADKGQALARQFSGPLGPPASLLDQAVITLDGTVDIPMRMIFACTSLGLIPGFSAPIDIPRHLRVSTTGRWVRIDAPFGSVYRSTSLSLF
ncbi:hypothetical protein HCH15_10925 [Corynebacterium testudinoris]|uniref:Uncharacterized protein n=1 Tax=Corynebacterium testudinoris TaxID=136857 RepID=A0A0G3HEA9_9CORY|nr:hypothetical protein [Corynebacterium testudinoris]AKK09507.1 hypothetical protein CTEST_10420 [Corynebacterium testudinoris]MBX8996687.1 hypothetical protein [Corynebacterium testudinoris]